MTTANGQPLPKSLSSLSLLGWVFASLIVTAAILAGVLALINNPAWWSAFKPALVVAAVAAVAGLLPIIFVIARVQPTLIPQGVMAGMLVRMVATLSMLFVEVRVQGAPRFETACLVLIFYAAMLLTEVGVLVRGLRRAFPMPPNLKAAPLKAAV